MITFKTMNSGQTHLSIAVDGLAVASNNKSIKKQWIKLPKSCKTSDLLTDAKELANPEKLRKGEYLDRIWEKICQDDNMKVIIVIGTKIFLIIRLHKELNKTKMHTTTSRPQYTLLLGET